MSIIDNALNSLASLVSNVQTRARRRVKKRSISKAQKNRLSKQGFAVVKKSTLRRMKKKRVVKRGIRNRLKSKW
jgi:hypothetical protein